jgi:cystathionine beta-lyase
MLGAVSANERAWRNLHDTVGTMGLCVGPDDMNLGLRGLRTMGVRLKQHGETGLEVAHWLQQQPMVSKVIHPALPGDAGYELWARDFKGAAGLFAFAIDGDDAARVRLVDALDHFGIGFSWGGFESLALPIDPERCRTAKPWAIPGKMIRLQIGLEDPSDLIADLERGLAAAAQ